MGEKTDHKISKEKADEMRKAYADKHPEKTKSFIFDSLAVGMLASEPMAEHFVISPAINDAGEETVVITTLDADLNESAVALDFATPCPPCLNS